MEWAPKLIAISEKERDRDKTASVIAEEEQRKKERELKMAFHRPSPSHKSKGLKMPAKQNCSSSLSQWKWWSYGQNFLYPKPHIVHVQVLSPSLKSLPQETRQLLFSSFSFRISQNPPGFYSSFSPLCFCNGCGGQVMQWPSWPWSPTGNFSLRLCKSKVVFGHLQIVAVQCSFSLFNPLIASKKADRMEPGKTTIPYIYNSFFFSFSFSFLLPFS